MKKQKRSKLGLLVLIALFLVVLVGWAGLQLKAARDWLYGEHTLAFYDYQKKPLLEFEYVHLKEEQTAMARRFFHENTYKDRLLELVEPSDQRRSLTLYIRLFVSDQEASHLYFDQLLFPSGIIGLGTASKQFFNKEVDQLTELEMLYLVAISSPNSTEVTEETASVKDQVAQVAEKLIEEKEISQADWNTWQASWGDLEKALSETRLAPYFSFSSSVVDEAAAELELSVEDLARLDARITTTLQPSVQDELNSAFAESESFPLNDHVTNPIEASMVVLDQQTGETLGMVGGRHPLTSFLNRATDLKRPPASTFKPLVVYGPALDQGWQPDDVLKDVPLQFGNFQPKNYDYKYRKTVSLEEALVQSYNVPTVWLLDQIGLPSGQHYLQKLGLFTLSPRDNYRIALGFLKEGTSPFALAQAYTAFANDGQMQQGRLIKEIATADSTISEENQGIPIYSEETASQMRELLQKVVDEGTGQQAKIPGEVVYGKTGTTSYDSWFVGSTDRYTAAVWIGTEKQAAEQSQEIAGGSYPAALFNRVMSKIIK